MFTGKMCLPREKCLNVGRVSSLPEETLIDCVVFGQVPSDGLEIDSDD